MLEYGVYVRPNGLFCKDNSHMYELSRRNPYIGPLFQHEIGRMLEYGVYVREARIMIAR